MWEQVEETIQHNEDGELEPVESSDLAAPTVIVKKIELESICTGFKMAVNPHLCYKVFHSTYQPQMKFSQHFPRVSHFVH